MSAWVLMYDESTNSFYLFKRPEDSQEAPGAIDLLWGCMNTKDGVENWVINPWKYVQSRIKTKSWLDIESEDLKILWVQEFNERWFYNLVYLYKLNLEEVKKLNQDWKLARISNETIDEDKNQDNPWWSALTLALEYLQKIKSNITLYFFNLLKINHHLTYYKFLVHSLSNHYLYILNQSFYHNFYSFHLDNHLEVKQF